MSTRLLSREPLLSSARNGCKHGFAFFKLSRRQPSLHQLRVSGLTSLLWLSDPSLLGTESYASQQPPAAVVYRGDLISP